MAPIGSYFPCIFSYFFVFFPIFSYFPIYFLIFSYFSYDYRIFCVKFVGGSDWFLFSLYFFPMFFLFFRILSLFFFLFFVFSYLFPIFSYFSHDYRIFCVKFVGGSDWFLFSLYFFPIFFRILSPIFFLFFSYFPIRRSYFQFVFVLYLNRIYFVNK